MKSVARSRLNNVKYGRKLSTLNAQLSTFFVPLQPLTGNRDVAQLVAHYVRDVGVGRSSRLIPTQKSGK